MNLKFIYIVSTKITLKLNILKGYNKLTFRRLASSLIGEGSTWKNSKPLRILSSSFSIPIIRFCTELKKFIATDTDISPLNGPCFLKSSRSIATSDLKSSCSPDSSFLNLSYQKMTQG